MQKDVRCLVGLKHAFLSQMSKQLPARNVLHEHVQASGILSQSIKVNLSNEQHTIKGWLIELRILYSLLM